MSRPTPPEGAGRRRSIYFSAAAERVIEENGFDSNLSNFMSALVISTNNSERMKVADEIFELTKQVALMAEELNILETTRNIMQAEFNMMVQLKEQVEKTDIASLPPLIENKGKVTNYINPENDEYQRFYKMWRDCKKDDRKGAYQFKEWLNGPANKDSIRRAGFRDAESAVEHFKEKDRKAGE